MRLPKMVMVYETIGRIRVHNLMSRSNVELEVKIITLIFSLEMGNLRIFFENLSPCLAATVV